MKGFFKLMTKKKIEFFTSNMIHVTLEVTTKYLRVFVGLANVP